MIVEYQTELAFLGDLKITLRTDESEQDEQARVTALLRLHEEEDGSCLWQAKCSNGELGNRLKELLR